MPTANPADTSSIIEPTVEKANGATAAEQLSAGLAWRGAAVIFALNVRLAHAVFWPYLPRHISHRASAGLPIARKPPNHLEIDRNGRPAVEDGRPNKLAGNVLHAQNLVGERG